jgi:opacity protein-like surface antigen
VRNVTAGVIVVLIGWSGATTTAQAQAVFVGAGWTGGWDDETNLGKGLLVSGGVAYPLGRHLSVEGEVSWARHLRDSGYLAADGTPLIATARLAYWFPRPGSRARPFASAGISVVHSTGYFTWRTAEVSPGGSLIEGPSIRSNWWLTSPAFELGAGVAVKAGERLSVRPEARWTSTMGADPAQRATLEPPLWILRAGVTVEWRLRR